MKLDHVLKQTSKADADLDLFRADELKKAARFWVGKAGATYRKDQCVAAIRKTMGDASAGKVALASLSDQQREAVAICARYGATVSSAMLRAEMLARGLAEPRKPGSYSYYHRTGDLIHDLLEKLVLLGSSYDYYYGYDKSHVALHPAVAKAASPAAPLSWQSAAPSGKVQGAYRRSSAEVAIDVWQVAMALRAMATWPIVKGEALAKSPRNRLRKEVGLRSAEQDPLAVPDPESLCYELLKAVGLVDVGADKPQWIQQEVLDWHFQQPAAVQARHWVRAWMQIRLWQDGIGVVPDRDNDYDPVRIEPSALRQSREMLVWALCRVAHGSGDWLDLETFLRELWNATHHFSSDFYWHGYTWNPEFDTARQKDKFPAGDKRSFAFWLDSAGVWAANAIMVTLPTLALVERGETSGKNGRPCFRLTELGRAVFGAPEIEADKEPNPAERRFLTVQPNLDVLAYLDAADARQACTLARFAARDSAMGGQVQTFVLRRESVYQAMESGMTLDEIRSFLTVYGRTELPANVLRTLSDWTGKRESLAVRTRVAVAVGPVQARSKGRALSDAAVLLPDMSLKKAANDYPDCRVVDHHAVPPRLWTADELGGLTTNGSDGISQLRLATIADSTPAGWQISQQSISRARALGLTAEQVLHWLGAHLAHGVPALLEMAIRNWSGRQTAFLGKVHLLQISRHQARDAVLYSPAFQPLLAGHIAPDWFLVCDDKVAKARRLLESLGFSISQSYHLSSREADEEAGEGIAKGKRPRRRR